MSKHKSSPRIVGVVVPRTGRPGASGAEPGHISAELVIEDENGAWTRTNIGGRSDPLAPIGSGARLMVLPGSEPITLDREIARRIAAPFPCCPAAKAATIEELTLLARRLASETAATPAVSTESLIVRSSEVAAAKAAEEPGLGAEVLAALSSAAFSSAMALVPMTPESVMAAAAQVESMFSGGGAEAAADQIAAFLEGPSSSANVPIGFCQPLDTPGVVTVNGSAIARVSDLGTIPSETDVGPIEDGNPTVTATTLSVAGLGSPVQGVKGAKGAVATPMVSRDVFMGTASTPVAPAAEGSSAPDGDGASADPAQANGESSEHAAGGSPPEGSEADLVDQAAGDAVGDGASGAFDAAAARDVDALATHMDETTALGKQMQAAQANQTEALFDATRQRLPSENIHLPEAGAIRFDQATDEIAQLERELATHTSRPSVPDVPIGKLGVAIDFAGKMLGPLVDGVEALFEGLEHGVDAAAEKLISAGAGGIAGGITSGGLSAAYCTPGAVVGGVGYPVCVAASTVVGFGVGAVTAWATEETLEATTAAIRQSGAP